MSKFLIPDTSNTAGTFISQNKDPIQIDVLSGNPPLPKSTADPRTAGPPYNITSHKGFQYSPPITTAHRLGGLVLPPIAALFPGQLVPSKQTPLPEESKRKPANGNTMTKNRGQWMKWDESGRKPQLPLPVGTQVPQSLSTISRPYYPTPTTTSGQSSIQLLTINSQRGDVQIPVDVQAASIVAAKKRRRTALASARYRARKTNEESEASKRISRLGDPLHNAREDAEFHRHEQDYLEAIALQQRPSERISIINKTDTDSNQTSNSEAFRPTSATEANKAASSACSTPVHVQIPTNPALHGVKRRPGEPVLPSINELCLPSHTKRKASQKPLPEETLAKKQPRWTPQEENLLTQLQGQGAKGEDIAKRPPRWSLSSCRIKSLHNSNGAENDPTSTFCCYICKRVFDEQGHLETHIATHRPWKCDQDSCSFVKRGFRTQIALQKHKDHKHNDVTYECLYPPCTHIAKLRRRSQLHMEAKHGYKILDKQWKCAFEDCRSSGLSDKYALERHYKVVHQHVLVFKCPESCSYIGYREENLEKHMLKNHEKDIRGLY